MTDFKQGDILKCADTGCLMVIKGYDGKLYAHWFFLEHRALAPALRLPITSRDYTKIGEFTADMGKAIEQVFLEAYKEKGNEV